jgi:hypothetical protein
MDIDNAKKLRTVLQRQVMSIRQTMDPKAIIARGGQRPSPEQLMIMTVDTIGVAVVGIDWLIGAFIELEEASQAVEKKGMVQ